MAIGGGRRTWRRGLRRAWPPLLLLLVLLYFGIQAMRGERGLYAWLAVQDDTRDLQGELERLKGERVRLEQRVQQLRQESIDPDRLEEELRKLGYAGPDELIILEPNDEDAPPP
ncbi:FtsB family cell division protein [Marinivivus vitaminiproducens]|uniref:FtsB family cell division protein n=1 Tax=Marinivivus vitaminiproducens TaxID=3035935 RepID=UPI002798B802|nr:septum formation initiator family protein [Geminicoccaceae bacterium SCSIO 64248]